jgi:hypothetical protein
MHVQLDAEMRPIGVASAVWIHIEGWPVPDGSQPDASAVAPLFAGLP